MSKPLLPYNSINDGSAKGQPPFSLISAKGLWLMLFIVGIGLCIWQLAVQSNNIREGCTDYVCTYRRDRYDSCIFSIYKWDSQCFANISSAYAVDPKCEYEGVSCSQGIGTTPCPWMGNIRCNLMNDVEFDDFSCPSDPGFGPCYSSLAAFLISMFALGIILCLFGFTYTLCVMCPAAPS